MPEQSIEINIDGMIGPTHHFGGLGVGNIASISSEKQISNPREAAMEGLAKMEIVASLGLDQFYLPPPVRPNWKWLESVGFVGNREDILKRCFDEAPRLLSAAYSSAFMWTANAATVAPSSDTLDRKLHLVPANLCSNLHRGQEAIERRDQLRLMFRQLNDCEVHEPLPSVMALRDEGAANHMRICNRDGQKAIHVFVYGPSSPSNNSKFYARQTEQAARCVARTLKLDESDCVFAEQSSQAIQAGVFHNDVIAMSNGSLMVYHENAFANSDDVIATICKKFEMKTGEPAKCLCVLDSELPLDEAVRTYLFNSQLLSLDQATGAMEMVCPSQCRSSGVVSSLIGRWLSSDSNPIQRIRYLSLDQSMKNGGGPACLRLRVMLNQTEIHSIGDRFKVTEKRLTELKSLVNKWYPYSLEMGDLARVEFANHAVAASHAIAMLV